MKGNFDAIIQSQVPVLTDFYTDHCAPCQIQTPILKELVGELGNRIKVIKIDIDKNPHIATRYQINGVPTLMLFKNGQVKFRYSGVLTKPKLYEAIVLNI